jgi:hypothetical protein
MIITIHHLVLSCSVCLGAVVGDFFVITHVVGYSLVAATSSRPARVRGAAASDHVGCFCPRKPFLCSLLLDR